MFLILSVPRTCSSWRLRVFRETCEEALLNTNLAILFICCCWVPRTFSSWQLRVFRETGKDALFNTNLVGFFICRCWVVPTSWQAHASRCRCLHRHLLFVTVASYAGFRGSSSFQAKVLCFVVWCLTCRVCHTFVGGLKRVHVKTNT
jgi:hypothetical protein